MTSLAETKLTEITITSTGSEQPFNCRLPYLAISCTLKHLNGFTQRGGGQSTAGPVMTIIRNLLVAAAVASFASLVIGRTDVVGLFQKFNCIVHDPVIIQNVSCWVKSFNWTYALANMRGNIVGVLTRVKINIQLHRKSQLRYRPFLVNVTEDYCAFFAKNRASSYLRIMWPLYMDYTNLNHTCPYSGETYIKDLPLTSEKLPQVWPPDNYRVSVTCFEDKHKLFTMEFYLEIKEKVRTKQSIGP